MESQFLRAHYRIETPGDVERAAAALAGEQSCGTFVRVAGETDELRARAQARVERIIPLGMSERGHDRADLLIAFPFSNVGINLPTAMATVAGNLFELREFSGLRLLDIEFPEPYAELPGPQFGIAGTQSFADVAGRPMIGTIIKPSVGLAPAETAELVATLAGAGIDFIKDDELMADPPHSPLAQRVPAVMGALKADADRTGKLVMYAFNITDEPDAMKRHHDLVQQHGGTCVMVSLHHVGVSGLMGLRRHSALPIHGHRNGWGIYSRNEAIGIDYRAMQKVWRLAGADHLHVNGLQNKFHESDDSVVRSILACLEPLFRPGDAAMPVISSGQWGGQVPETYRRTKTLDVMYLAGGGVMAHPGGPAAGVSALRQAWDAAVAGVPLTEHASDHPELAASLRAFGARAGA